MSGWDTYWAAQQADIRHREVDAWERRRLHAKQDYVARGMSERDADEQATADIRREIRNTR